MLRATVATIVSWLGVSTVFQIVSPWVVPLLSLVLVTSLARSALTNINTAVTTQSPAALVPAMVETLTALPALGATLVLLVHAPVRTFRRFALDALSSPRLIRALATCVRLLSLTFLFSWTRAGLRCMMTLMTRCCDCINRHDGSLLQFYLRFGAVLCASAIVFGLLSGVADGVPALLATLSDSIIVTAIGLPVFIIAVRSAQRLLGTAVLMMGAPSFAAGIAEGITNPRMCPRCLFGPVDHTGCSALRTHHGERRGRGTVSNACPRCHWLGRDLREWARWPENGPDPAAVTAARQARWGEAVVISRAVLKAVITVQLLLRFAGVYGPIIALVYFGGWLRETHNIRVSLRRAVVHVAAAGDLANRRRQRRRHRRRRRTNDGDNPPDCGRRRETAAAEVTLRPAIPERIFYGAGAVCVVCLETFPPLCNIVDAPAALDSSESMYAGGDRVCLLLRQNGMHAMRCGHVLHVPCFEGLVSATAERFRHVLCPVCREPVTRGGALASRLFS